MVTSQEDISHMLVLEDHIGHDCKISCSVYFIGAMYIQNMLIFSIMIYIRRPSAFTFRVVSSVKCGACNLNNINLRFQRDLMRASKLIEYGIRIYLFYLEMSDQICVQMLIPKFNLGSSLHRVIAEPQVTQQSNPNSNQVQ